MAEEEAGVAAETAGRVVGTTEQGVRVVGVGIAATGCTHVASQRNKVNDALAEESRALTTAVVDSLQSQPATNRDPYTVTALASTLLLGCALIGSGLHRLIPARLILIGAASASTNGTGADEPPVGRSRAVATSPAVGIFQPGSRAASGTRVRAGDSLGTVNVLGVPQDVLAPVDGIVGSTLVEAGMAVEYGQDLIRIELATPTEARS